ncbi:hypothetical protein [Streptomyces niveus]
MSIPLARTPTGAPLPPRPAVLVALLEEFFAHLQGQPGATP